MPRRRGQQGREVGLRAGVVWVKLHLEWLESASQDDMEQECAGGVAVCGKSMPGSWNSEYEELSKVPELPGGGHGGRQSYRPQVPWLSHIGRTRTHTQVQTHVAVSSFNRCFLP